MKRQTILLFLLLLFSGKMVYAQHAEAEAVLDRESIKIGEQTQLKLAIRYREGSKKSKVIWPEFKDTLTNEIEIVKLDSIKTMLASRASVLYEQSQLIIITAFDSGVYIIPEQLFIVDGDTVRTESLQLSVTSVRVDTLQPIKGIKGIYEVPPPPINAENNPSRDWWYVVGAIALVLIIALIFYFTRKKKTISIVPAFTKQLLPHEKVLEQLAELGRQKPWLHGELKQYHISLTEILRSWVVERYRIHAKEMTTVEIIRTLQSQKANSSALTKLDRVLRTADMVKFAKGIPEVEENENMLLLAMKFVEDTAIYPEPPKPEVA